MDKSEVLRFLQESEAEYISGGELCKVFHVSRTAVWKVIGSLREEGYQIDSVKSKGYRLSSSPDLLKKEQVMSYLSDFSGEIYCFDSIDSTNTEAKRRALEKFSDPTVIIASEQTAGRGRLGRSFASPKDKGLYLSLLKKPDVQADSLVKLTAYTGVAVCNAIERATKVRPQIKWTNDIVLGNKKLCGILTEMTTEGESGKIQSLIVGIGINVLEEKKDFETSIASIATSILEETGEKIPRSKLAALLIEELDAMFACLCKGEEANYLEQYKNDLITLGREVVILRRSEKREGVALDIDEEAALIVRYSDTGEIEKVRSGEVSVRGLFGYV